jgi:hypothetical protein
MDIARVGAPGTALVAVLALSAAVPALATAGGGGSASVAHRSSRVTAAAGSQAPNPRRNPHRNRAPTPDYLPTCETNGFNDPQCIKLELAAIRNARKLEGVKRPALVLPSNYSHLSTPEQVFVVTNLERVGRGLRPFRGLTHNLSAVAHASAVGNADPMLATATMRSMRIYDYGSIWASDLGPLGADYDWMYNDGYSKAGVNIACLSRGAEGCWGHRENILGSYGGLPTLIAGAGTSSPAGRSVTELLAGSDGKTPQLTYRWKNALRHGANRHPGATPAKRHVRHQAKHHHRRHHGKHHHAAHHHKHRARH